VKKALALLLIAAAAHADGGDPVRAAATPAEQTVLDELDKEQLIKARTDAEAILETHADSLVALYAMARIQHDEEGNHARALYYMHRAQAQLPRFATPVPWDKKLLREEYWILHEMDRMDDALAVIDRYEKKYDDTDETLRIWPLFKLGRMNEARALGKKLAASDNQYERQHAYNGMLSLEFEAHNREETYRWAIDGVEITQSKSCNMLRNASGAAFNRFRLKEAEDLALRAHKAEDNDCEGDGYDQLTGLYLTEGEFEKSVAALESLMQVPIPKRYRPQFAIERRALLAEILHALGRTEDAERLAREVYELPERTGMTSSSSRAAATDRAFRYWQTLDARLARLAEMTAYRPMFATLSFDTIRLLVARWTIRRELVQLLADDDLLISYTRPDLGEPDMTSTWQTMTLADIVGTGVMADAVTSARALDAKFPEATPYLDLFDGELAYRRGDYAKAADLAAAGLAKLPREEALMRYRALAWQADALRRLGKLDARPYHEVLQKFPSVLRILDLAVPVTIDSDSSPAAAEAARRAGDSPRFSVTASAPFAIHARTVDGVVELCLADTTGFQFACARGGKDDPAISALDAFHEAAFSPKVALSQSDLSSLDGSPVRVSADQVVKGILGP
jgi:tetratricopeptide (TPR) repeat protein